jgi:hypothetical protein
MVGANGIRKMRRSRREEHERLPLKTTEMPISLLPSVAGGADSKNYSADLVTRAEPCIFDSSPDCSKCGDAESSAAHSICKIHVPNAGPPADLELQFKSGDVRRSRAVKFSPKWSATRWTYSRLMTEIFQSVRLVIWFSQGESRFIPALFYENKKTAVYAMSLAGRFRVCPKCDSERW